MGISRLFLAVAITAAVLAFAGAGRADDQPSLKAKWEMPPVCDPMAPPRIKDLKEELKQTGYRLVIALHPAKAPNAKGEYPPRDLYLVNADGSGLKQITDTPDKEEHAPRVSPNGKYFTYNYGDFLVDAATLKTRPASGGYVWTPDSNCTVSCEKSRLIYTDVATDKVVKTVPVKKQVSIVDLTVDGKWFIFEIRNYLGKEYTIDFMSADGGDIRKLPNHAIFDGECHPAFSPDGKWTCWNGGGSLAVRKFDPSLPDGTDGNVITLPKLKMGQDPCGRWSHCGRYIAYVKIPHLGTWKVHSPICIVRVSDGETITISPPGMVGHHWDYDWLPPAEK